MLFRPLLALFLLVLTLGTTPAARGADVALVLSENGGVYGEFASAFQQFSNNSSWKIRWIGTPDSLESLAFRADLIIAVGSEATRVSLRRGEGRPTIATLLPRQAYERAMAENPARPRSATAIYLDQPVARLMAFAHFLLPDRSKAGVLVGADTRHLQTLIRQGAASATLNADIEDVESDTALVSSLNQLLSRNDFLVALPDSTVYRRDNIRVILLTSYRYQKPVVAFSQAFVTAGALAAIYSSPAQIARQAAELVRTLPPDSIVLPPAQGPTLFSIAINRNVAQALGLSIPDEPTIRRAIGADKDSR